MEVCFAIKFSFCCQLLHIKRPSFCFTQLTSNYVQFSCYKTIDFGDFLLTRFYLLLSKIFELSNLAQTIHLFILLLSEIAAFCPLFMLNSLTNFIYFLSKYYLLSKFVTIVTRCPRACLESQNCSFCCLEFFWLIPI